MADMIFTAAWVAIGIGFCMAMCVVIMVGCFYMWRKYG